MSIVVINEESMNVIGKFDSMLIAEKSMANVEFNWYAFDELDDLDKFSGAELVNLHNNTVSEEEQVKKFRDKATAMERTWKAIEGFNPISAAKAKTAKRKKANAGLVVTDNRMLQLIDQPHKKFQKDSIRGKCFEVITNGMTVGEYIEACTTVHNISRAQAMGSLHKMSDVKQKYPTVAIK